MGRAHRKDDGDKGTGHGFDLAAVAAEGPVVGSDPTNGVVDLGDDDEGDGSDSAIDAAIWRTGQANIAGLGGGGI